jgi:hypothetical protein
MIKRKSFYLFSTSLRIVASQRLCTHFYCIDRKTRAMRMRGEAPCLCGMQDLALGQETTDPSETLSHGLSTKTCPICWLWSPSPL